jgi:transposase
MRRAGGFSLQRRLTALGIDCYVVCPQKLDEQNKRVKTDSLDARALCLKLDRFLQGKRHALALVRVPSEEEEQARALHRQREQLVKVRKVLEAQGRRLMVNHGIEPVQQWWKNRAFATLGRAAVDARFIAKQSADTHCTPGADR